MKEFETLMEAMREFIIEYDLLPDHEQKSLRGRLYAKHGGMATCFFKELDSSCIDTFAEAMRHDPGNRLPRWVVEADGQRSFHYLARDANRAVLVAQDLGLDPVRRRYEDSDLNNYAASVAKMGRILGQNETVRAGETVYLEGFKFSPNVDTSVSDLKKQFRKAMVRCD